MPFLIIKAGQTYFILASMYFSFLINSVQNITGPMVVMWLIGGLLIWLAIKKDYEPALLLPMGFGAILVNLPDTGVLGDNGIIQWLYNVGIGRL